MERKFLITGALGQIGSELAYRFREKYGREAVIVTDLRKTDSPLCDDLFEQLDVLDGEKLRELVQKYQITNIIHLGSILSAVGEKNPQLLWKVNVGGMYTVLEVCREFNLGYFAPSSIAAFGLDTPMDNTPQDTIMHPGTMYGISKVIGELMGDYYYKKYGVDARSVRFPGLISYKTLPGGGTTDYAVEIYYEAIRKGKYTSFMGEGTYMDMMYMPDAIDAIVQLIEADPSRLIHRNAFNITAMSFAPEDVAASIKKFIPEFEIDYDVDPERQAIADSWPNSIDDTDAKNEWDWNPKYNDIDMLTKDMLENLKVKLSGECNGECTSECKSECNKETNDCNKCNN